MLKYQVIVADPPWSYKQKWETSPTRTAHGITGAISKYSTMTIDEIKSLDIKSIADPSGCVLFLWVTQPMLPHGVEVMSSWGFTYKTCLVWVKRPWLGMGMWFRVNTEYCLVGICGGVKAFHIQKDNIIYAKPTKHSRKPDEFFEKILPITAGKQCIELFAREKRKGWNHWGNEV